MSDGPPVVTGLPGPLSTAGEAAKRSLIVLELVAAKRRKTVDRAKRFLCLLADPRSGQRATVAASAEVLTCPRRFAGVTLDQTGRQIAPLPRAYRTAADQSRFWRTRVLETALRKGRSVALAEPTKTEGAEDKGIDAPGGAPFGSFPAGGGRNGQSDARVCCDCHKQGRSDNSNIPDNDPPKSADGREGQ